VDVRDAVLVIVRVRAAVLILEVVEVFRIVRALIDVILDAVAVAVANRRLEDETHEYAPARGRAVAGIAGETNAAAQLEKRVARQIELDAAERFGRTIALAGGSGRAVDLPDDVEFLRDDRVRQRAAPQKLGPRLHLQAGAGAHGDGRIGRRRRQAHIGKRA